MTAVGACGFTDCPVPTLTTDVAKRLRTVVLSEGTVLRRGHKISHPDPSILVPGVGDTRFAPLRDAHHVYVATTTFASLLESAFHDAAPPEPRIAHAQLALWAEGAVSLTHDVRLFDLRDGELDRLGVQRRELVATSAAHYPCTRTWAEALLGRRVGGYPTHGLLWHSRQRELHARALANRPALQELLDEHPAEVAVLWAPPAEPDILERRPGGVGPLDTGQGRDYVDDLIALLGVVSQ